MLRLMDFVLAMVGLLLLAPVFLVLLVVGFFDTGSPLFCQQRVGRHKKSFTLIKFRTMKLGTASVASHLASTDAITAYGQFLRRTKLDELPQLWNVLVGDMSLVGPRPGLFNQKDLLDVRDSLGVFSARPGITGLAQISNIDMSTPELLAETDARMLSNLNFSSYCSIIIKTLVGNGRGDAVRP